MKKLTYILLAGIILYLLGSFTAASFNIAEWHAVGRGAIAAIYGIVICAIIELAE